MFRGCKTEDMPPHIYSLAQTAYRTMLETRRDQSLIFMGRSGSGKTTSFKHALYYLALAAGEYIFMLYGNFNLAIKLACNISVQISRLNVQHSMNDAYHLII